MNKILYVIISLISLGYVTLVNASPCDTNPEGFCITKMDEDDNNVRAWFDRELDFDALLLGYDLMSSKHWTYYAQENGSYKLWNISNHADYAQESNSLWFTAYRAREAQCWKRSELLYFNENWAGTNFLQQPKDSATGIPAQDILDRASSQGVLFDSTGQPINFCNGAMRVSQRS